MMTTAGLVMKKVSYRLLITDYCLLSFMPTSMRAKPLILCAVLLFAAAHASPPPGARAQSGRGGKSPVLVETQGNASSFSGQRAYEHVRKLVEFGPRPSGSKELALARRYIVEQL